MGSVITAFWEQGEDWAAADILWMQTAMGFVIILWTKTETGYAIIRQASVEGECAVPEGAEDLEGADFKKCF